MRKKVKRNVDDVLQTPALPLRTFGTGDVARLLGTEIWRVQKYLDSPKYRITPTTSGLGSGKGSRRVFTDADIYRLGIAEHLVQNGFSYKFVSAALQQLEDEDLLGPFSEEGEELDRVYVLAGGEKNLAVRAIGRDKTIGEMAKAVRIPSFYVVDLNAVIREIQTRMRGCLKRKLQPGPL
jgi:DNA-binding transcriptional MerR regulator